MNDNYTAEDSLGKGAEETIALEYNTERENLRMPEYGRNVLKMVEQLKAIEDRDKRSQQAKAVVKVMELLNPQIYAEESWERKLWDHLFIMSNFELDVDSPYPAPTPEQVNVRPSMIPLHSRPVKARHYGRNIESVIELIASQPDGEVKDEMLRALAIYMRQQYLIWNKDSVADETIFADIEKLSDGRVKVPEGMQLPRLSQDASFARPSMSVNVGQRNGNNRQRGNRNNNRRKK